MSLGMVTFSFFTPAPEATSSHAGVLPSVSIQRGEFVDETTLIIFPAITFGNPRANVSWLFDGEVLDPITDFVTISDEGVLTVTNFVEGSYTVLISNIYGTFNDTIDTASEFIQTRRSNGRSRGRCVPPL